MNRAFRIVWNESLQAFVVAPEFAKARGKRSSTGQAVAAVVLMLSAAVSAPSWAGVLDGGVIEDGGTGNIAYGPGATIRKGVTARSSAIGANAEVMCSTGSCFDNLALGAFSKVDGRDSTAIGANSYAKGINTTALGNQVEALANNAVAIGANQFGSGSDSSGSGIDAASTGAVSIGYGAGTRNASNGIAIGTAARSKASDAVAIGTNATSNGQQSIVVGTNSIVNGANSGAIGSASSAAGANSYVIGNSSGTSQNNTFVLGNGVFASQGNSVVLGNASTDRAATTTSSATIAGVAFGTFAGPGTAANGVVSVGAVGKERQLINVAAGEVSAASTDAVNGSQLYSVANKVTTNLNTMGAGVAAGLGGGAAYNAATGAWTAPSYTVQGVSQGNVGSALSALDTGLTTTKGNVTTLTTTVNNLTSGTAGLVQQAAAGQKLTVGKGTNGTEVDIAGTGGTRKLTSVTDGTVAAGSKDAVNGGQLFTTNQQVATNTTNIAGNTTAINTLNTSITNGTVGLVQQAAAGQKLTVGKNADGTEIDFAGTGGSRKLTNVTDGTVASGSKDAVNGGQLFTTNQQVATNSTNIATNTSNIAGNTTAITNLTNGTVGLVQQAAAGQKLTVGKNADGTEIDIAGTAGSRKLTNVTNGTLAANSKDAVNGGQLFTTNQQVATNATNIANNTSNIAGNTTAINTLNTAITNGTVGLVQQAAAGEKLTVGKDIDGSELDLADKNGSTRKLTSVTDGTLAANSKDAVNGGQLFTTNAQVASNTTNIATNTSNIAGNTTAITNLTNGTVGLVQQAAAGQALTVGKATDGTEIDFAGTGGTRKLTSVADGAVAAGSKDAVNGGQLFSTNQQVATNTTNIAGNTTAINTLNTAITNGSVGLVQQAAVGQKLTVGKGTDGNEIDIAGTAGTRKLTSVTDGTIASGSTDAVNGGQLFITNEQVATNTANIANNTSDIAGNTTAINILNTAITNGAVGLVQQAATGQKLTVGKGIDGSELDLADKNGNTRTLTNVTDGTVAADSKDAVNGGQLFSTNQQVATLGGQLDTVGAGTAAALGGGAVYDPATRTWTAPSYSIQGATYSNIGAAVGALDSGLTTTNGNVTNLANTVNNISNGTVGLVQQAAAGQKLTVGKDTDGSELDLADKDGNTRTLTSVTDGTIAAGSKDAVNGGQLFATNQQVETNTTNIANNTSNIAGNTTAITNLTNGTVGLVQQAAAGQSLTVGRNADGIAVDFAGTAGSRKLTSVTDGTLAANSKDAINASQLFTTNQQVETNTTNIAGNTTAISTLNTAITNGAVGLVQQAAVGEKLTVGRNADGTELDIAGTAGTRKVASVTDGLVEEDSKDAVNGGQLFATNQQVTTLGSQLDSIGAGTAAALGGGAVYDPATRTWTAPSYSIQGATYSNVGAAVGELDSGLTTTNDNVTNLANTVNSLSSGTVGLVQQAAAGQKLTVGKDTDGSELDLADKDGNTRTLTRVTDGTVAANSKDAVNGSQLFNTNQQIATLGGQLDTIGAGTTAALGGGAVYDPSTRTWTAPSYSIQGTTYTNVGAAAGALDAGLTATNGNVSNLANTVNNLSNGTMGLVQQAAAGQKLTVGKDTDGTEVDFAGAAGTRTLTGVTDGTVAANSKEAVNGGQLHAVADSMANALGGGSTVNADGSVSAPVYNVTNVDGSTSVVAGVEGAISNLDNRVDENTQAIAGNTTQIMNLTNKVNSGGLGLVQQDAATGDITVAGNTDGNAVNVAGTAGDRTLTGVAAGTRDNDAVNVAQLKQAGVVDANGNAKSVVSYDNGQSSLTLGGKGSSTPVALHNVANGVSDYDAVNVGQLNQRLSSNNTQVLNDAYSYTDRRVDDMWQGLNRDIDAVNRQANRGIAAASALIDVTPYVPGRTVINAGIATYRGEAALGVGMSRWSNNGRVNLNAGVSAARGDSPVIRVGLGYVF